MEKNIKKIIFVFFLISLVKIILNFFVRSPSSFADSYFYVLSSKALINLDFTGFFAYYPPLYSFIISWVYLFNNSEVSYFLIKLTNSFISSLVIFPAYLLAKEYLKDERISFYTALIIGLLPSNFAYSTYVMSENIFNFLFLMTIYSLYIGFKKSNNKLLVLSSLLIVLCYMTKVIGIFLFPVVILFSLIEKKYKEGLLVIILSLIILIPYFIIKNSLLLGYENLLLNAVGENNFYILKFLFWIILYPFFLYLQGFIIFTNSAIKSFKNSPINRLFITSIFFILAVAIYHGMISNPIVSPIFSGVSGRPMERYLFSALPLIIIMGIGSLKKFKINYFLAIPFSILMLYPLLPPNNIDITWLGIFSFFIKNQILLVQIGINFVVALGIIFIINHIKRHINLKRIIFVLFILNLIIFTGIAYDANTYYLDRDDTRAGKYINEIAPNSLIVIDEKECTERFTKESKTLCDKNNHMSIIGFWNKNVVIGNYTNADYFISKRELNLNKIKSFGEINIYET